MPEFQTVFRLGRSPGEGVFCDAEGLSVGQVALLELSSDMDDDRRWRPRPLADLNRDLSRCYGPPIEIGVKAGGLEAVAKALGRGDLAHAQMVALHLRFPDPPDLQKSAGDVEALIDLARRLEASDLLKRDFDPDLHPRWPAGRQDSSGGRFAPAGSQSGGAALGPAADGAVGDPGASPEPQQSLAENAAPKPRPSSAPRRRATPRVSNTAPSVPDLDGAVLNDGVYYENGTDSARPDRVHIDPLDTIRANIVNNALKNVNSTKWSDGVANINFGNLSDKCNLFVYDMLTLAAASPGLPDGHLPWNKYPPVPAQWVDPRYHIPGWVVLTPGEKPQPGDVVAQRIHYSDADGHVMIVGPYQNGKLTFIGTGPARGALPIGTVEMIAAKLSIGQPGVPAGPLIFRRYIGVQQER